MALDVTLRINYGEVIVPKLVPAVYLVSERLEAH